MELYLQFPTFADKQYDFRIIFVNHLAIILESI